MSITVDAKNSRFLIDRDFVIDKLEMRVVRYFGESVRVYIWKEFRILGNLCFSLCQLESIIFESGSRQTRIDESCFKDCSLKSICIPRNAEIIGKSCFYVSKLESITFEKESCLTRIDESCFNGCSLKSICIPRNVEIFGKSCFASDWRNRNALESITFESESHLVRIGDSCFSHCSLKSICIPRNVELICGSSFQSCPSLSAISFESNSKLTRIGSHAFYHSRIESVVIPQNVGFIGGAAFEGCSRLSAAIFELGSKIISIESSAFRMTALHSLVLPPIICFIGADAIPGSCDLSCPGIEAVSAFSDWNTARCQNLSLVFELPSSPAQVSVDRFIVRLSDYRRIKKSDNGRFGVVHLSEEPRTKWPVVIKVMRHIDMDEDEKVRYTREVEILASVDHPTLLALRGFVPLDNETGDPPAIVTDFMPRGSYDELITAERRSEPPLGWDATSRLIVLYGIAVGMKIFHSKRIMHWDLKLKHILLDEAFEPCITSFYLSKSVEQGHSMNQWMFEETLRFMAPEIHVREGYDWSADVYAYGMLVYVATTGLDIFPGLTGHQLSRRIMTGYRPPFPAGLDSRWQNLIEECWRQDPQSRPTFQAIVARINSTEFVGESIDVGRFRAYESRVLPAQQRLHHDEIARTHERGLPRPVTET
jgi:hypothetical protein